MLNIRRMVIWPSRAIAGPRPFGGAVRRDKARKALCRRTATDRAGGGDGIPDARDVRISRIGIWRAAMPPHARRAGIRDGHRCEPYGASLVHRPGARRLVESLALVLQGSLLVRHAPHAVADAFCASRLGPDRGLAVRGAPTSWLSVSPATYPGQGSNQR